MITTILLFASIVLSWDQNTEKNLGGYKVYTGTESGKPSASMNVGKVNQWNADQFLKSQQPGTKLYFVVTAYNTENKEGKPTNEVTYLVPIPPGPSATPTPTPIPIPAHTHTWEEITGKPATFPNQPHRHPIHGSTETGQ